MLKDQRSQGKLEMQLSS
jgi:hypothetical protein